MHTISKSHSESHVVMITTCRSSGGLLIVFSLYLNTPWTGGILSSGGLPMSTGPLRGGYCSHRHKDPPPCAIHSLNCIGTQVVPITHAHTVSISLAWADKRCMHAQEWNVLMAIKGRIVHEKCWLSQVAILCFQVTTTHVTSMHHSIPCWVRLTGFDVTDQKCDGVQFDSRYYYIHHKQLALRDKLTLMFQTVVVGTIR